MLSAYIKKNKHTNNLNANGMTSILEKVKSRENRNLCSLLTSS